MRCWLWFLPWAIAVSCSVPLLAGEAEPVWKNAIGFPDDTFQSWTSPAFIKFTIIRKEGYDPNLVYYQDSRQYEYHYDFALEWLEPFVDMTIEEFDDVTLHSAGQEAVLGAVIFPTWHDPPLAEYGVQLVRQDPYTREEVVALLSLIEASVQAESDVTVYYFPTYEQFPIAQQNRQWFADQGYPLGSTAQWAEGNAIYAPGWALGRLTFVPGNEIQAAYTQGELTADDILLTDGVPAEVPTVAGILSLMPATPNSHVAILARSQGVPFAYLADEDSVDLASQLVGHDVYLSAGEDSVGSEGQLELLDASGLDEAQRASITSLKSFPPLVISPIAPLDRLWGDTTDLQLTDISYFGGKAANFGVLRRAIPNESPQAMAFSFDLWNAFLDRSIAHVSPMTIEPGEHLVFWADGEPDKGPLHLGFGLSRSGEAIGLFDGDGVTLIDSVTFGPQQEDVSYGRSVDGGTLWQSFQQPTPGYANGDRSAPSGLVINEFMADNGGTIEDPNEPGQYSDWIELYNGSDEPITLSGLFLTDRLDEPTRWQLPVVTTGATLRDEIASRLAPYQTYPPQDTKALATDLMAIRSFFGNPNVTDFGAELELGVISALNAFGFDSIAPIRFRSSTNVEDSAQFVGAGLYDSYSGRLMLEDTIFGAIRRVFASFYNDNAFLERLRHGVDESDVGMALLVHHSFPDEIELANGVATMERGRNSTWNVELVSQKGAVSVTNPPVDAVPEIMSVETGIWGPTTWLVQRSSLVPLRDNTVFASEQEYLDLYDLLVAAAEEYCQAKGETDLVFDLEYKKIAPEGRLVVKQIREIPLGVAGKYDTPFLLSEPVVFSTLQGRGSDVLTNHRLKARWTIAPKRVWLSEENLTESIYDEVAVEYVSDGQVRQLNSILLSPEETWHIYEGPQWESDRYDLTDNWRLSDLCNGRTFRLRTTPLFETTLSDPVVTLNDLRLTAEVDYDVAVPLEDDRTTQSETAPLYVAWEPTAGDVPEECVFDDPNTGVYIHTQFRVRWRFWGFGPPTSAQFVQTQIEGLTSEPIVLTDFFSQTVGGGSHLCPKNFLFEPGLEPGISPQILAELRAQNIRLIHYTTGGRECRPTEWEDTPPSIRFYGFDEPIEGISCDH